MSARSEVIAAVLARHPGPSYVDPLPNKSPYGWQCGCGEPLGEALTGKRAIALHTAHVAAALDAALGATT